MRGNVSVLKSEIPVTLSGLPLWLADSQTRPPWSPGRGTRHDCGIMTRSFHPESPLREMGFISLSQSLPLFFLPLFRLVAGWVTLLAFSVCPPLCFSFHWVRLLSLALDSPVCCLSLLPSSVQQRWTQEGKKQSGSLN